MVVEVYYHQAEEVDIPKLARFHRLMFEEMYVLGVPNDDLPFDFEMLLREKNIQ